MRRDNVPYIRFRQHRPLRAGRPLVGPPGDGEGESPPAKRGDHQPAAHVGGIRLRVTRRAERHQAVEIEVRAALGAFDRMVQIPG
jgi:hypothetical protein